VFPIDMDIYTPIEEAGDLIRKRWADTALRAAVVARLGGDIPEILNDGPSGLIFRQICTPDGEFLRFEKLCEEAQVKMACLEYVNDKFHSGNITKYALGDLAFFNHMGKNGQTSVRKERIINFNDSGGKMLSEIKTSWGESLVDFHHHFLRTLVPATKDRIFDISEWVHRHGHTPQGYYPALLSFAISHVIYFDDFDLLQSETGFIDEVVLPAFKAVEHMYGLKISGVGEHDRDPYWWCYSTEARVVYEERRKHLNP
jgi:hypothetical protein